jgi:hypothetical protein
MPTDRKFRAAVMRSHRRTAAALGAAIGKVAVTPLDADPTATGLVVMAMLERSWLMVSHNEIAPVGRGAALAATTELLWRTVNAQP